MIEKLNNTPYLKHAGLFYILLGGTDIAHHLHAAIALEQPNAMHAFWIGVVLMPIAILIVIGFAYTERNPLLWAFILISALATLAPGIYHGGWVHLVNIVGFLRIEGESTHIYALFPADNLDLWFHEISGSLEFLFALFSAFFLTKVMLYKLHR